MASIIVDESNLTRSILGYLLDKGCFESLNSLLLETNLPIFDTLPNEFLHLQRMILQGRWNDVLAFVGPVCDANSKIGQDIKLLIGKQQYLESLSWQGGGMDRWIFPPWRPNVNHSLHLDENIELNTLVALLNSLKPLCSVTEFNSLCLFLTLEHLEDHPEYSQWTVPAGRYNCCTQLLKFLLEAFQQPIHSSILQGKDNLTKLVATAVETVIDRDTQHTFRNDLVSSADNIHLKNLDTVMTLIDKKDRNLQRVTWVNKVKIHTRNMISSNTSSLNIVNLNSRPSTTGVITRHHVENEFASTVPWPSAGERMSSLPQPVTDDDPFASSQEMASPQVQRLPTASSMNHSSHPPSSSSSAPPPRSAEAKRAMSWTVDVTDTKDSTASQGPATGRKSLHTNHSQSPAGHALSQAHSQSHANQLHNVSRGSSRGQTREKFDAEHETACTVHTSAVRASHGKMPGLTSPYSSQDISVPVSHAPGHGSHHSSKSSPSKHHHSSHHNSLRSSREDKAPVSSAAKKVVLTTRKGVLWDEPCPLRCVSVLDENTMDGSVTIAVGTNAKAVHLLQFRPRDLDVLAEETFRGAAASQTEILDVDGIVQDLTQDVQHIYTFEKVHNGSVYAMDYHKGSSILLSASNDKTVRIIKPNTRQLGANMKGHTGTIRVVKFAPENNENNPQGSQVLAASAGAGDFKPRLWDIQTESCQRILTEHKATIHGLVWINENVLVTGCEDGILTAHDIRDRAPMWSYSLTELLQHTSGYEDTVHRSVCALEYVPLLGCAPLNRPAPGAFEPPHLTDVLAIGCLSGSVTFLQTSTTPAKVLVDMPSAHSGDVRTLLALPEYLASHRHTPLVFSASYDATANLWACATAQRRIDPVLQCTNRATLRAGHSDKVLSAAALRDSASIITSGADGRVVLWNLPM